MPKWEDAYGRAPEAFNQMVESTLNKKLEETDMRMRTKTLSSAWVIALVLLVLMGTALAITGSIGLLDFRPQVNETQQQAARDGIVDLSYVPAMESPLIRYQVREALVDGNRLMFTITAEALNPEAHLLMPGSDPYTGVPGMEIPFHELAAQQGKAMVNVRPPMAWVNGMQAAMVSVDNRYAEDVITWLVEPQGITLPEGEMRIEVSLTDSIVYDATYTPDAEGNETIDIDEDTVYENTLTFALTVAPTVMETLRFNGPFECEYMTVDWVELLVSPMATYTRVQYTLHEDLTAQQLEDVHFIGFLLMEGPDDDQRPQGGSGSTGRTDGLPYTGTADTAGITFLQELTWAPMEALPDTLYLRPHYALLETMGDTLILPKADAAQP